MVPSQGHRVGNSGIKTTTAAAVHKFDMQNRLGKTSLAPSVSFIGEETTKHIASMMHRLSESDVASALKGGRNS